MILGKDFRLRERAHYGSQLEVQYALMPFGINLENCFTVGEGIMSEKHIEAYIQQRREKEAKNDPYRR